MKEAWELFDTDDSWDEYVDASKAIGYSPYIPFGGDYCIMSQDVRVILKLIRAFGDTDAECTYGDLRKALRRHIKESI